MTAGFHTVICGHALRAMEKTGVQSPKLWRMCQSYRAMKDHVSALLKPDLAGLPFLPHYQPTFSDMDPLYLFTK